MALAIASTVAIVSAAIAPTPTGTIVGGSAGVWEVNWADGRIDPAAVSAGLSELTAAAPAAGDPVAGDTIAPLTNPNDIYISGGLAVVIGGVRWWAAFKPGNTSGQPYLLPKLHAAIVGHLPL